MGDRVVDLTVRPTTAIAGRESWGGAAERGLQARQEREAIVARVLKPGVDYGVIPGTNKATMYKSGAEKTADSLNLYADYETLTRIEDWDKPLFHMVYRCVLRARGSDAVVVTGIGSCNSMESRYRWRESQRKCPACGAAAIIKGKKDFGGGWLCWSKKGGCGAKYADDHQGIISQPSGKVPNDDVFSQVNTIDKMAQKRALVAATLNLGFSEQFTQDMEDVVPETPEVEVVEVPPESPVVNVQPFLAETKSRFDNENLVNGEFTVQPQGNDEDWILDFGKFKDQSIRSVDNGYLIWLEGAILKDLDDPNKAKYKPRTEENLRRVRYEKTRRAAMAAEAEADELEDANKALNDADSLF